MLLYLPALHPPGQRRQRRLGSEAFLLWNQLMPENPGNSASWPDSVLTHCVTWVRVGTSEALHLYLLNNTEIKMAEQRWSWVYGLPGPKASGSWDTERWRPAVFFPQFTIIRPRNQASLGKVGSQPFSSGPSAVAPLGGESGPSKDLQE